MSLIGEAALSTFIEMLLGKLASFGINFVKDYKQVRKQLKKWQSVLPDIQGVLNDAEDKQIMDERVKSWLVDLTHLAYDMDDILDEFAYEELRLKLQKTQAQASTSKLRKLIPASCTTGIFTPSAFKFNTRMISAIKEITSRLNDLATRRRNLGLAIRESNGGTTSKRMQARRPQTTSLPDETHVYGREKEKQKLLGWLNNNQKEVSVFPIVGMGGMGKTTLAQFVYNHNDVKKIFDLMAWTCVSEEFDTLAITKTILQSVMDPKSCSDIKDSLDLLQQKLKEKLSGKSILLVLDDVWNENYVELSNLIKPFGVGTKIILTTRSKKVASIIGTIEEPCILDKLSNEDCLPIFTKHALGADDFSKYPNLEEEGKCILKKCDGLPLAAKAIGGLLRNEDHKKWKQVSKSEIWELSGEQCGILPALRLSYHCLPPHLKRCFAYCSILPKDYEFKEEEITLLWKAEGFLEPKSESQPKDLVNQYFCELVSRSFFQPSSEDKSRFGMHDLMNDLAQLVAGDICSKLESDKQQKLPTHTRHSSYIGSLYDGVKRFESFNQVSHLRTFLPLMLPWEGHCYLTNIVLDELLPRLEYLRVLSLNGYNITELPDIFKILKHLRYLDFSDTSIKCLPDSICFLYHLETLILRRCILLEKLPSEIGNLFKLHYLDIRGTVLLRQMPLGIDQLINLQRLSDLILGEGEGYRIRDIKNFSCLRRDLCLSRLENITDENDAGEAKLSDKLDIDKLKLKWSIDFGDNKRNEKFEEKVLGFLSPHKMVKKLSIENYGGINFSTWIIDASLNSLSSLRLKNCRNCKSLPSIGSLPLLKDVWISGMVEVTKVGLELFGVDKTNAFASLESLHLEGMLNWKEWDCFGVGEEQVLEFPKLRELYLVDCPQLVGRLPNHLHSLQKLVISGCMRLVVSVSILPLLCELEINECEDLIYSDDADFTSLKKVTLSDISKYNISEERVGAVHQLSNSLETEAEEIEEETLHLAKISRIESLSIWRCEKPFSRLFKVFHSSESLTEMEIENYSGLVSLVEINSLPALKKLVIWECHNLQCLVDERENIVDLCTIYLLPEHLQIKNCDSLLCLSSRDDVAIRLRHLTIVGCSKLTCLFLNRKFPVRLKEVEFWSCPQLESIGQEFRETSLLESITIRACQQLKSLPRGLHKLSHLQSIYLYSCSNLVIFEEDESWLATHLKKLTIYHCPKIEALPKSINKFTSLRLLRVGYCSVDICFPEEGFPTKLTHLSISAAPKMYRSLVDWGFHKFTCLQEIFIGGRGCSDVVSFPGMMQLPPSLTQIHISDFENLKCISSNGFQNLTSLHELYIYECPKLKSLPEKDMLLTLGCLVISNCPWLKEECQRNRGRQWSKIAHIPLFEIDGQTIIPKTRSD